MTKKPITDYYLAIGTERTTGLEHIGKKKPISEVS